MNIKEIEGDVTYYINEEKRTVVAILYEYAPDPILDKYLCRGIAKCSPNDVFNESFGKRLALHRARQKRERYRIKLTLEKIDDYREAIYDLSQELKRQQRYVQNIEAAIADMIERQDLCNVQMQ